jgi:hypothetical protein
MAWYPDLGRLDYFDFGGVDSTKLRAVGWLARKQAFSQGDISPAFLRQLRKLLVAPWQPFILMGFHQCELCPVSRLPRFEEILLGSYKERGDAVPEGKANLFVPGEGCVYVAPELIVHYIDAHRYKPPDEFIRAVMECPPTRTAKYQGRLLLANDGRSLAR